MRMLIFTILVVLLLPLILLGYLIFFWRIRRVCIPQNISGTANEPYGGRLYMHVVGTRPDEAGYKLAWYLPSYGGIARLLIIDTLGLACKISGYKLWVFSYPGPRPSSMATAISHLSLIHI